MVLEDVATMSHDDYKLQMAKLKYEELDFMNKLKAARQQESENLRELVNKLPDDPEELLHFDQREFLSSGKLQEHIKKYVSLVNLLCSTTAEQMKLKATYNGYNKLRLLELMEKLPEITDDDERKCLHCELVKRMEWMMEDD